MLSKFSLITRAFNRLTLQKIRGCIAVPGFFMETLPRLPLLLSASLPITYLSLHDLLFLPAKNQNVMN